VEARDGKGREGTEGGERVGKGERSLDFEFVQRSRVSSYATGRKLVVAYYCSFRLTLAKLVCTW